MSTVALVFLAQFTWTVSSGTWIRLHQCAELRRYGCDEEAKSSSLSASYQSTVICDKTKQSLSCQRPPAMSVGSERIPTENGIKEDCVLFPGVYLNYINHYDCGRLLKNVKQIVPQNTLKSNHFRSRISCLLQKIEMPSKFTASLRLKEARLKPSGGVKSVGPINASRWIAGYVLGVVLLLGIYMTRIRTLPNRNSSAHGSNSTMEIFFTMRLRGLPGPIHQPTAWVAVRMSFVLFLSWSGGRTVHVLIACRTARTVMKLLCRTQKQFVTGLFIWLTFSYPFPSKHRQEAVEGILVAGVGSTLGPWSASGQIELLATLLCGFVSLSSWLQSILDKLNVWSVFLHVQLVTCL